MISTAVFLAGLCWAFTFALPWGNFWLKISASVIVVCLYSLRWERPTLNLTPGSVAAGVLAAAVLYGIFGVGNALAPYIVPGAQGQVGEIHALGAGTPRALVFLLLCLVTGPGEEIFWRGFLQGRLVDRWGPGRGFALTTLIYGGVHAFSLNLMLVLAALTAGVFWGGLYLWRRDLGMVIVSHSLWSACIFVVAPIR
ncbi:MAG: CPBP family intramembrane metalloprotease [Pseudomonadota bacterium]|nr:CPBP family intramembrane metalloprotease [Pseudomonadota bacterium]